MYSRQSTPRVEDKQFVNIRYNITSQTGTSIAFNWGEYDGPEQVTAKVTFSDDTTQIAKLNFDVVAPGTTWTLTWRTRTDITTSAAGVPQLAYGSPNLASIPPGMAWSVSATAPGMLSTVQIATSGFSRVSTDPTIPPIRYAQSLVSQNPTTGEITPAPFPLVDTTAPPTPFYGINGSGNDSPQLPLLMPNGVAFNARELNSFKDTEMYQPPGGIWVPLISWTWSFDASATKASGVWVATDVNPPSHTNPVPDNVYPTWNDTTAPYLKLIPVGSA